jgi:deoxyribonuclease-4
MTKISQVRIALENTAGQGTCLGAKTQHLAEIYQKVQTPRRLGLCLDTAHFFAAGYDIRTPKGWNAAMTEVDKLIGLKEILAFHLNDSKTDLGSHVDRHAHIGQGKIGREGFRTIVNDPRFAKHPGCLETPKSDDLHEDIENLKILRSLVDTEPSLRRPKNARTRSSPGRQSRAKRTLNTTR